MGYRLPSYDPDACCKGTHCIYGTPETPCWGPVLVREELWDGGEESGWLHACEGHAEAFHDGTYRASDRPEDAGAAVREDDA